MGRVPGEAIGRQDDHGIALPTPSCITQPVQRRPIQPCSTDAIIALFMFWQQGPLLVLNVIFE
jgi:hypothetical protein